MLPLSDRRQRDYSLLRRIQQGDRKAEEALLRVYAAFIARIANQYGGKGVEFDDLYIEGQLGLLHAARKFDTRRGQMFSTYAGYWVKQRVSRIIQIQGRAIYIPAHLQDTRTKLRRAKGFTLEEIAAETGSTVHQIRTALNIPSVTHSLDAPLPNREHSLYELCVGVEESPESVFCQRWAEEGFEEVLSSLPAREQQAVRLRYGFGDGEEKTLDEVGEVMQVTRERVRQILKKALERLQNSRPLQQLIESGEPSFTRV